MKRVEFTGLNYLISSVSILTFYMLNCFLAELVAAPSQEIVLHVKPHTKLLLVIFTLDKLQR